MTVECSFILVVEAHFDRPTSPHVRFYELTQVCAIAHSLLLYRVRGTTYLSIYVILHLLSSSSAGYERRISFVEDNGS